MANYVLFEVYIPASYLEKESGILHATDKKLLNRFTRACYDQFGGITRSNPHAPPLYEGWWYDEKGGKIAYDYHYYVSTLVKSGQVVEAEKFFHRWKKSLEKNLNQTIITVTFYAKQTLGGYLDESPNM